MQKVYDNLDFSRGMEAFLNFIPAASLEGLRVLLLEEAVTGTSLDHGQLPERSRLFGMDFTEPHAVVLARAARELPDADVARVAVAALPAGSLLVAGSSLPVRDLCVAAPRAGVTVLLVEQNTEHALALAHRGFVLESGRVALSGTAATELRFANRDPNRKLQDMNAWIERPRTPFDWLSRDACEVDAYVADPLCGFTIAPASRQSMFAACDRLTARDAFAALPKNLPVVLFTGDQDPVNNHLAWFHPLVQRLRDAGLSDVQTRIYRGARHEVLNETNRDEVTADLLAWIERAIGKA
jgi:energy-coupling factor transporter ATP-binding protein EcfA2